MTITAKVIEATKWADHTMWSLQLTYPRFIHSELMTHRALSKSCASSRAIPVKKVLSQVWNDPAMPVKFGSAAKGMQSGPELSGVRKKLAVALWKTAAKVACIFAWSMLKLGGAKEWVNRVLEPWQRMHTIISGTEWENFFELRDHKDAQPEFRVLAVAIRAAMLDASIAGRVRQATHTSPWHMPYTTKEERQTLSVANLLKISSARCARVSYLTHDGKNPDHKVDYALHDRLVGSKPEHASPTEHQAVASKADQFYYNLKGFKSYRKLRDEGVDFSIWYNGWGPSRKCI